MLHAGVADAHLSAQAQRFLQRFVRSREGRSDVYSLGGVRLAQRRGVYHEDNAGAMALLQRIDAHDHGNGQVFVFSFP